MGAVLIRWCAFQTGAKRHPRDTGMQEVEAFVSRMANERKVSADQVDFLSTHQGQGGRFTGPIGRHSTQQPYFRACSLAAVE